MAVFWTFSLLQVAVSAAIVKPSGSLKTSDVGLSNCPTTPSVQGCLCWGPGPPIPLGLGMFVVMMNLIHKVYPTETRYEISIEHYKFPPSASMRIKKKPI